MRYFQLKLYNHAICVDPRIGFWVFKIVDKEVIQPQVPLRLPCYDFTPVMNHTVVIAIHSLRKERG